MVTRCAARTLLPHPQTSMSQLGQARHSRCPRNVGLCSNSGSIVASRRTDALGHERPLHCNKQRTFSPIINSGNPLCCWQAVANHANFWSSAFASFRSSVSKPSVNQP
jgi:hypothetical protein